MENSTQENILVEPKQELFFQKKYFFIVAYLISILCIFLSYFLLLFSNVWEVFPQLSGLSIISIPILALLTLIFFFIKPKLSYLISFFLSLIITLELINVMAVVLRLKELVYGDIIMSPGFLNINFKFYFLVFGGIILTYISINGITNKYDSGQIKPLRKWFFLILVLATAIYFAPASGIFRGVHPKFGFIKTRLYECYNDPMSCSISLGNNYDLAKKQSPVFKEIGSTCIDCWVNGKLILPENDFPWLQVVMYLYTSDPNYRAGEDLNDKIIFKVDKGVTEVNFSLGDKKKNPGDDIKLVTWVYYGFYEIMAGEYEPITKEGYGVSENVIVTGKFVESDLDLIYSKDETEKLNQQLSFELDKKIETDMTEDETKYLNEYVKLENFNHQATSDETGQFSRTLSGSINNLGNQIINLSVLSVKYDNGETRRYVIINNREISKYSQAYKNVPPDRMQDFLVWDSRSSFDFREVDYDDPKIKAETNLEVISAYVEKIYFDW